MENNIYHVLLYSLLDIEYAPVVSIASYKTNVDTEIPLPLNISNTDWQLIQIDNKLNLHTTSGYFSHALFSSKCLR